MAKKNKGGRPPVITEDILRLLEDAFLSNATYAEAAIYADISETALYDYKKEHPEFTERVELLRGQTGLAAKINIRKKIKDGSIPASQWHLERRDPDYKPKSEVKSEVVNMTAYEKKMLDMLEQKEKRERCNKQTGKE